VSARRARGAAQLRLRGLRAGNLRALDLDLPLGAWTAVHGPSGAGKSALLFGVLEPVARRRFRALEDPRALPSGDESWLQQVADVVEGLTPVIAGAGEIPRGRQDVTVGVAWSLWTLLESAWERGGEHLCVACGAHWPPWQPRTVAAQHARWSDGTTVLVLGAAAGARSEELLRSGWTRVRLGADAELARLEEAPEILPSSAFLLLDRMRWGEAQRERLIEALQHARARGGPARLEAGAEVHELPADRQCPRCGAHRDDPTEGPPGPAAPARWLHGRPWSAWTAAPLEEWLAWSADLGGTSARRLALLARAGIGHLSALRTLGSLSLGEARRLELVSWLALVRSGQTVLLDEPGMGLHGRERLALAAMLQELAAAGNTVLTADPAREFLEAAHRWILLGPGGGPHGGTLVAEGDRAGLPPEPLPAARAARGGEPPPQLTFRELRARHLRIPELALPLGRVVAVCGPSGCGKSTLFEEELVPRLRAESGYEGVAPEGGVGVLLERALRHAPISTVATLSGAWTELRTLFADGEEARMRGLAPGDFVARPGLGACPSCGGTGAGAEGLACAACGALGLRKDLLDLRWRGRSLREWLALPLEVLAKRLPSERTLPQLVQHLVALGLGPRSLGERGRHLSLGERSRIALARALSRARSGAPRLFLLDEPCLGLPHPEAQRVSDLLHALAARGHGFWVVEHHELFLRQADWLVEIGPGAGARGGELLHAGPPADWDALDTPTAAWWRARAAGGAAPTTSRREPPRSRALAGGLAGAGRAELERALRRELAVRSPLLHDAGPAEGHEESDGAASVPVAWPVDPDPHATLGEVLGLAGLLPDLRRRGEARCAACGGGGPWRDLEEAARAAPVGEWVFSAGLPEALLARAEHAGWLRAAGFRRFLRAGAVLEAGRGAPPPLRAGDAVWLDRFDPAQGADAPGRLRDLEHHRRALGVEELCAHPPDQLDRVAWRFRPATCRDCGVHGAGTAAHFHGWNLARVGERRLDAFLSHVIQHVPEHGAAGRAQALLAGTSLLTRTLATAWSALTPLEARLARLTGWLLFPLPGAVLLCDAPLAGFPNVLARRLAAALVRPPAESAFWFTDAEEHGAAAATRARPTAAAAAPQGFDLAFDFAAWCRPARAEPRERLRHALGIALALREHFARTDAARLAGIRPEDLDPSRSALRCPACRGSGEDSGHPALSTPCRACRGSGFGRQAAQWEDRGLRWSDLGHRSLADLRAHFAESPALAAVLAEAEALGLGGLALDAPLRALPPAVRMLAPLAGWSAAERAPGAGGELRIGLAVAGLNGLEARVISSRIERFSTRRGGLEWRDHHPVLAHSQ
jgi:excinuclease ABC subunit A